MIRSIAVTAMLAGAIVPSPARGQDPGACTDEAQMEEAPSRRLVGYWRGGLEQSGAIVLRLGMKVEAGACGGVVASLDSPDQGAQGIGITGFRLTGDSLHFQVPSVGGAFRGQLDGAGTSLRGSWSQGGGVLPMTLALSDSTLGWARPQNPTPPFPYDQVAASYVNPQDGTRLAGTLTIPPGSGPFPAALMLTGSGAQDRDESLMGHKPFLVIADYLTRRGIAVLRVDDRGVGGSSGNVMDATLADNVGDAAAGVDYLRKQARIDPARVGVIGHSEGGWVAPELATEDDSIAFVVMLAGPAATPQDLLLAQSRAMLEAGGEGMVEEQLALTRQLLGIIREEPDNERARLRMREAAQAWLEALPAGDSAGLRARLQTPEARAQFEQSLVIQTTPWFRGLIAHDPFPALEALDVPVLALFGELDLQVPPAQSAPVLQRIWADHPDATVRVLPRLNHLFQHAATGMVSEYAQIEETFAPEALELVGDWIVERVGR